MKVSMIVSIAAKEFRNSLRNRWVLVVSIILGIFALSISYFGSAGIGKVGFSGFESTIISLGSLVTYLVPIIALTLGYDTIVGEVEGKTLELLLTMPVTRDEIYLGKFLGLAAALTASLSLGFGAAGAVIAINTGTSELAGYFIFIFTSILMGLSFLALAMMISVIVRERARATGAVIFVWFSFVLVFDLILIGVLVGTGGKIDPQLFPLLLYLNPTDLFRLIGATTMEGVKNAYGLTTLAKGSDFDPGALYAGLVAWIALPLGIGYLIFRKRSY